MISVSIQKEYPSKGGGYFYTGLVKVDDELSFFPRVNQYEDGNIKVTIPDQISILSEKTADQMYQAFCDVVKKIREAPGQTPEPISFGEDTIMKSIEGHLTPSKDGSTPTVWENSKYNSHASITFDFSDSTGEKIFGIDTTLRSRSDGSGKFIALPSKLGSDGKYYKEVSCSREISNLLNEKGLALYDEELSKKNKGIVQESTQKPEKKNTQSR